MDMKTLLIHRVRHGEPSCSSAFFSVFHGLVAAVLLLTAPLAQAQLRYDIEYPAIGYGKELPQDAFSRMMAAQEAGELQLEKGSEAAGYLESVLDALDIDPASQILVFSKTSQKQRLISTEQPRALYFNDEVYIGYVPGSRTLEVAAMDPAQGQVFFDFEQEPERAKAPFTQETSRCLRCHDSYSLSGGGVPRFLLQSVLANADGNIVSHEISEVTTTATPISRRWGGLFVTGTHGDQPHMGNLIVNDAASLQAIDTTTWGNRTSLEEFTSLEDYPRQTSDIVALLVLEHQIEVQNALTRLNFETRQRLAAGETLEAAQLDELTTPLLDSLFMANEVALGAPIAGTSGYAENFQARGPRSNEDRSLRQLDLQEHTFHYPLSYLIYSDAIDGLAEPVRTHLFGRIKAVLAHAPGAPDYPRLTEALRADISAILRDTKPEVLE